MTENSANDLSTLRAGLRRWGLEAERLPKGAADARAACFLEGLWSLQHGEGKKAIELLEKAASTPELQGWALLAQAAVRARQKEYERAATILAEAALLSAEDAILRASVLHLQGAVRYHQADSAGALPLLEQALELLGAEHFLRGRVLDTLGMLYGQWGNFHASQAFFEAALTSKEGFGDESGLALSHGQLGRLFFSWGRWDGAQTHFEADLALAQKLGDVQSQVVMHNALGRLSLARGNLALALGQREDAEGCFAAALESLRAGIALCQNRFAVALGFAHKDVALVLMRQGALEEAERELTAASTIFQQQEFGEGNAHVDLARGILHRLRGEGEPALARLATALTHFQKSDEQAEAAQTLMEIASARGDGGANPVEVRQAWREALREAERCRHPFLVRQIEAEWKKVDPAGYYRHLFLRTRGRSLSEETSSLLSGIREVVTIFYLDLKGSTDFARRHDPAEVMLIINQMLHELTQVIEKQEGQVLSFRGDGFLALFRGDHHARRAVRAGLEAEGALVAFNRPRRILGLVPFVQRIGIATGEVVLGNVGTYHKMDFAGVGNPANLGARLEANALPGYPCVSDETHAVLGEEFSFREESPRSLDLKGFGMQTVWDVTGLRKGGESADCKL